MTAKDISKAIVTALAEINDDDPDVVAERLAERGIKGVMCEACDCVVARYLKATVKELSPYSVRVDPDQGTLNVCGDGDGVIVSNVRMPSGTSEMAGLFDEEAYPELVDRQPKETP